MERREGPAHGEARKRKRCLRRAPRPLRGFAQPIGCMAQREFVLWSLLYLGAPLVLGVVGQQISFLRA
eukprot:503281-Alexandrium_andersonii.AAC.1